MQEPTPADFRFRLHGVEVPATSCRAEGDVLHVGYRARYYGSSTRSVHAGDIIREDGHIAHTTVVLTDASGATLCELDTRNDETIAARLDEIARERCASAVSTSEAAAAAAATAVAAAEEAADGRGTNFLPRPRLYNSIYSASGRWYIALRELHRFASADGIIPPQEISEVVVQYTHQQ